MTEQSSIAQLVGDARKHISLVNNHAELEQLRLHYLGKKGILSSQMAQLRTLEPEQRRVRGGELNVLKDSLHDLIQTKRRALEVLVQNAKLQHETVDVSLPGVGTHQAHLHPITITKRRVGEFFTALGYQIVDGPEIENDYYNFEALNFQPNHPARDMQDTFMLDQSDSNGLSLLRTHTSNVQVRCMEKRTPPVRTITMGRVYRHDSDVTHTPMFHQLECLLVDEQVSFVHLKATLTSFVRFFFEKDIAVRFRPSFFPFTEPSAEVDIGCVQCDGVGCRVCKDTGWLEVLGSGLVHPRVLEYAGIDSERYSGFAFGVGLERIAMLRYHIDDLRLFFTNDWDFLQLFH